MSKGVKTPIKMIDNNPSNKIGVRTLPKMVKRDFCRRARKKRRRQEIMLKSSKEREGNRALIEEKERVIHLGIAPKGPRRSMILKAKIKPGFFPILAKKSR